MTAREFQEWAQYERIAPFGEHRADLRAVFIAWMIYSVNQPSKKRGGKPMSLRDFMDEYWPDWLSSPEEVEERRQEKVRSKIKSLFGIA